MKGSTAVLPRMKRFVLLAAFVLAATLPALAQPAKAVFASGCFWCTESDLEKVPGVISVVSGYSGGHVKNPTYEQVSDGGTGHREAVEVTYDPKKVSYAKLLDAFWHDVDPFDDAGQFCDKGTQYRGAIFVRDAEQRRLAEDSKRALEERFGRKMVTEIVPAAPFFPAEDYHQDYAKKNPLRYHFYRFNCGRDQRLESIWGKAPH
jgi:peptide-methionine (S)-S-oxide reductase